ncbi:MAG: flagellin [Bacillota bacterium]|nr:flagellin [Bacillota bacterium]
MRINHNISALNAYRNLEINNENTSKSLEKLSSGLRINRAADDAAGLAISEKMRSQIRGLDMAERNALDGVSVVQTADGALNSTQEILQRMRELSVQAANDSNTDTDREEIQKEVNQLTSEINRIANTTEFNTGKLLDGSKTGANALNFQIGANAGQSVTLDISDMTSTALLVSSTTGSSTAGSNITLSDGTTQATVWYTTSADADNGLASGTQQHALDVSSNDKAQAAITVIDDAIQHVSSERAHLGAVQNRLEYTVDNLKTMNENVTSSESRIRDVDMAEEMTNFTKNNILNQAAQAMLAQANQLPQGVLQLLK